MLFSVLFAGFSWFFWWFMLFCRDFGMAYYVCFFGANICGPNLHRCYSKCFFHLWFQGLWMIKIVSPSASRFRKIRGTFISKLDQGKRLWGKCSKNLKKMKRYCFYWHLWPICRGVVRSQSLVPFPSKNGTWEEQSKLECYETGLVWVANNNHLPHN